MNPRKLVKMNANDAVLHGECIIKAVKTIPADAKVKNAPKGEFIIGLSESVGNHHVIDINEGDVLTEVGTKIYLNSKNGTTVRCKHADRHDAISLPAGNYEFGTQQEYDPFTARMNAVKD